MNGNRMKRTQSHVTRRDFLAGGPVAFGGLAIGAGRSWGGTSFFGISQYPIGFSYIGLIPIGESGPRSGRLLQRIPDSSGGTIPMIEDASCIQEGDRKFADRDLRLTVWGAVSRTLQDAPDMIDVEVL